MEIYLKIALRGIVFLRLLPFVMTQLIVCDVLYEQTPAVKKFVFKCSLAMNVVINFLAFQCVHTKYLNCSNVFKKFLEIIRLDCSFQDVSTLSESLIVCLIISIFVGACMRWFFWKRVGGLSAERRGMILLILAITCIPVIIGYNIGSSGVKNIIIHEICRKTTIEEDKEISYIVLYNKGVLCCKWDIIYLSDDDESWKYEFHNIEIPAGGMYQITMDADRSIDIRKKGGTTVYLAIQKENILDSVTVPALLEDMGYRRAAAGEDIWETYTLIGKSDDVAPPSFSCASGFYQDAFELTIESDPDTVIYFTLDGSVPTAESILYQDAVHVDPFVSEQSQTAGKAFIVRAVAINDAGNTSEIATATYFVGLGQYHDRTVVSLIADPDDLFGDNGIYVAGKEYDDWYAAKSEAETGGTEEIADTEQAPIPNYLKRGEEWERIAEFEFFENGMEVFSQPVGIRIQGSDITRTREARRFSVYSRKKYSGSKWFYESLFGEKASHSIVLRDGFINVFSQIIVSDRDVAVQPGKPVSVFLNGKFWYETYMQEKYSPSYFSETYGIHSDNVVILQIGWPDDVTDEVLEIYNDITGFLNTHDLSQTQDYEMLGDIIDIQSFIDYSCINVYLANMDTSDSKNTLLWRTEMKENDAYGDGRWRWGLYVMDLLTYNTRNAVGVATNAELDSFSVCGLYVIEGAFNQQPLYSALRRNPDFCKQFVLTFMDLINTDFSVNNMTQKLEEWGFDISYDDYFFQNRAGYITKYMEEEFALTGTQEKVTLTVNDPDGGEVILNTIKPQFQNGLWSGVYYTDYPVSITAIANRGYEFAGWTIDGVPMEEAALEVAVEKGGIDIHAIFKKK